MWNIKTFFGGFKVSPLNSAVQDMAASGGNRSENPGEGLYKIAHPARMLALSVFFCAGFLTSVIVRGENGRDFTGQYVFSGVVANNHTVNAMLTVRIVNHAGHQITGARVWLGGTGMIVADNLSLAWHASQVIRVPITISSREFARWRQGPPLTVEYREADGAVSRRTVELIRTETIPGVQ